MSDSVRDFFNRVYATGIKASAKRASYTEANVDAISDEQAERYDLSSDEIRLLNMYRNAWTGRRITIIATVAALINEG